jgi:hypothetical protein
VRATSSDKRLVPEFTCSARWRPDLTDEYEVNSPSGGFLAAAKCAMSFYSTENYYTRSWSSIGVLHHLGKLGLEEATNIWPTKKLDILLMLGSGLPHLENQKVLALDVESPGQWSHLMSKWVEALMSGWVVEVTPVIFQLNPIISSDFGLDDVCRIAEISRDTDRWLRKRNDTIVEVANHFVAGLFCYTSSPLVAMQLGTISCRLPWDLEARVKLVAHLITVAHHRELFIATCTGASTNIDPIVELKSLCHGQDLIIKVMGVWLGPLGGQGKLDISMADIFRKSDKRYPISGSS